MVPQEPISDGASGNGQLAAASCSPHHLGRLVRPRHGGFRTRTSTNGFTKYQRPGMVCTKRRGKGQQIINE